MNTWRVQPSRAQWWFVRVYLSVTSIAFVLTLIWAGTTPAFWLTAPGIAAQVVAAVIFWRLTQASTTASESGITAHDGIRTRHWDWAEIRGIYPFGRYENEFKLDLRNGKTVAIPGVDHDAVPVLSDLIDRYAGTAGASGR